MSATTPKHDSAGRGARQGLRTALRLIERQRHVEREIALLFRGLDEVAELLYNHATRTADDAR